MSTRLHVSDYPLLIQGLLQALPPEDGYWSYGERQKWLDAAAAIFLLIYSTDEKP